MLFLTLSFHLVIVLGFTFSLNHTTTLPYKLLSQKILFNNHLVTNITTSDGGHRHQNMT